MAKAALQCNPHRLAVTGNQIIAHRTWHVALQLIAQKLVFVGVVTPAFWLRLHRETVAKPPSAFLSARACCLSLIRLRPNCEEGWPCVTNHYSTLTKREASVSGCSRLPWRLLRCSFREGSRYISSRSRFAKPPDRFNNPSILPVRGHAKQTKQDYEAFAKSRRAGRIRAPTGL